MSRDNDDYVSIEYEQVVAKTDKAVLLEVEGEEIWFPISKCPDLEDVKKGDGPGVFECPEWLAEAKELL